jgi:formate hydrogenlyase transcriptional activator
MEFIGAVTDITERKTADDLRHQETELRQVLDFTPQLIAVFGPNRERLYANQVALDYLGTGIDEWRKRSIGTEIHPDDRELLKTHANRGLLNGDPFELELRVRKGDGSYRWFLARYNPVRDHQGQVVRLYVACTDIEHRKNVEDRLRHENVALKRAEERIRQQEAELRQMLDFTPQLVAVFGPNRERLYVGRIALDYFGMSLDEWREGRLGEPVHPDDLERHRAETEGSLTTGVAYESELRLRKNDRSYRWFLARFNPMRDDEGRIIRWYVACTDIDDRKRTEERLQRENATLREEIEQTSMFEEIVGTSPALETVLSRISKVAPSDSTVLITGETGTGKELIARGIHRRSNRDSRAFISVNCAAIPRDLISSELFGHEKGAFTGATQRRIGRFELADGGTIFLDEVGELSPDSQVALLRVLQEREFERLGSGQSIRVDVRVVAASNRDLKAAVANGTFRQDLFYRLNVFPIAVPPLRERKEDIVMLVEYFVQRYATKAGKHIRSIDKKALNVLQSYDWPGNIRELQNVIERSVILTLGEVLSVDELWLSKEKSSPQSPIETSGTLMRMSESRTEREIIEQALAETRGRVSGPAGAAAKLRIPASTLATRIKTLKINKHQFKFRCN